MTLLLLLLVLLVLLSSHSGTSWDVERWSWRRSVQTLVPEGESHLIASTASK
jgi:hypothetical protein